MSATLFAYAADRPAHLVAYPASFFAPGSQSACTRASIPQVGETYAFVGTRETQGFGVSFGLNEHALAISRSPIRTRERGRAGAEVDAFDLVRLALERARDAREAVELLATFAERYGSAGDQHDSHHRFWIADPDAVWWLETSNDHWVARRTGREHLCLGPYESDRPRLRNDWEIGAKTLDRFASEQQWWKGRGRIDFARAYGGPPPPQQRHEEHAPLAHLMGRDHVDSNDARDAFHEHGSGHFCATVDLPRDREQPWPFWICTGSPRTGVFLPLYLNALPARISTEPLRARAEPCDLRVRELSAETCDAELQTPRIREAWKSFLAEAERERREIEREASDYGKAGRHDAAQRCLRDWSGGLWARAAAFSADLRTALTPFAGG